MSTKIQYLLLIVLAVAAASSHGYFWLETKKTQEQYAVEKRNLQSELELKESVINDLSDRLSLTSEELNDTISRLQSEKSRNDEMEEQINQIAGTVSDLDKLSKTDKELLQKYSKVYFLNEHYFPESLTELDNEWKYSEDKAQWLHSKVLPFFEKMLKRAKRDEIDLWVVSAFRSFETQNQLKGAYTVTYGSGANAFSADQGFSEHQLGTTIDFTTSGINGGLEGFGQTAAYQWLLDNAHKYGFTLSYPENNQYYVYEPWHWRFVGEELATYLHENDLHFYDLPQREIDQYLLNIFD